MDKPLARLWLEQAKSDLEAGNFLLQADSVSQCHTIAKYQQTVEKAIKAMVAALNEAGIVGNDPTFRHEVDTELNVLIHLPRMAENKDVQNLIHGILNGFRRDEIRALGVLSPQRPAPGQRARRNTEYPFQTDTGDWITPFSTGPFTVEEARRFQETASRVSVGASQVLTALARRPR